MAEYIKNIKYIKRKKMKEVVFINRKSKILNWFTKHKLDEDKYEKLINSCANNYEDIHENGTPENYLYRPCALQVQEMYLYACFLESQHMTCQ